MKLAQAIKRGFTLIELLVVIGILAILLAITLIAINPARQFAQANDTKKKSDVNAILNAIGQYTADSVNAGQLPAGLVAGTTYTIGAPASATLVDLCDDLVPTYIQALPVDPQTGAVPVTLVDDGAGNLVCPAAYNTGYSVVRDTNGRVTVSSTSQVDGTVISVTR